MEAPLNRIKEVIVENKSSNNHLAEYLGYEKPTISNWCTNTNQPSLKDMRKIAEFFKVDIRTLLVPTNNWEPGPSPAELMREKKQKGSKSKTAKRKG